MASAEFSSPLRKYKLVFLGEQSGKMATLVVYRQKVDFHPPSRKDIPHYSFHVRYFRQYISSKLNKYVDMPSYKRFFYQGYYRYRFLIENNVFGRQNCAFAIM